jgi:hypothetical protein
MTSHEPWVIDGANMVIDAATGEIIKDGGESPTRVTRLDRRAARRAAFWKPLNQSQAEINAAGRAACTPHIPVRIPPGLQRSASRLPDPARYIPGAVMDVPGD